MAQKFELFHYWRSSCSWRVRWALEIKGISYSSTAVDLKVGAQKDHSYLAKAPSGMVPCLLIDGNPLSDSISIIEWLDETQKGPKLLPTNPWDRAKVRELTGMIASNTQPVQNLHVLQAIDRLGGDRVQWARSNIAKGLKSYEEAIRQTQGSFSMGSQITLADLCLIPQVYNAHRFGVDMSRVPNCEAIYQRALKIPSCERSAPHNQPGATP
ncbi:MAG: maleylacetoacetate isomerase [Pseudobacteriovorax sp.]|nr:maleylacetoacetate isomerase [Pseudobacteriovorax sp.]